MAKKNPKLNPVQEIDAKLQLLMSKRLQAYRGVAAVRETEWVDQR